MAKENKEVYYSSFLTEKCKHYDVKKGCKAWESSNQDLITFPILYNEGKGIKEVPLFTKIPLKKIGDDPSNIPDGAIVVMKSKSKHGHIEIKTDKKDCGNQTTLKELERLAGSRLVTSTQIKHHHCPASTVIAPQAPSLPRSTVIAPHAPSFPLYAGIQKKGSKRQGPRIGVIFNNFKDL